MIYIYMHINISCHYASPDNVLVKWYLNAEFYDQSFALFILDKTYNATQCINDLEDLEMCVSDMIKLAL